MGFDQLNDMIQWNFEKTILSVVWKNEQMSLKQMQAISVENSRTRLGYEETKEVILQLRVDWFLMMDQFKSSRKWKPFLA